MKDRNGCTLREGDQALLANSPSSDLYFLVKFVGAEKSEYSGVERARIILSGSAHVCQPEALTKIYMPGSQDLCKLCGCYRIGNSDKQCEDSCEI